MTRHICDRFRVSSQGTVRIIVTMIVAALGAALLLTSPSASAAYPGADGNIAFVRSNQIYTITPSGTGLVKLTSSGKNYRPKWSPNGQRIAYINETATGAKDIWVMGANGSNKRQVTRLGNVTAAPSWSPDGKWLAFANGSNAGYGDLRRIRSTAPYGTPQKLAGTYFNDWTGPEGTADDAIDVDRFLAWSPDGTTIAVYNHRDGHLDDAIYMYDVATGNAQIYDAIGGDCCGYAEWSDLAWGPAGQFGYASIDIDSDDFSASPPRILYPGFMSQAGDTYPAPAPGNGRIAFTNASSGTARIYIANVNGSKRRLLTTGYQPDWQPKQ